MNTTAATTRERRARPSLIRALDEALDEQQFGGKAASLSRAVRAGLPVPAGFALSTEAVANVCTSAAPEALAQFLQMFLGPVAVRSSALGEDSSQASFAGQHHTELGVVGADAIIAAIAKVKASGSSAAALDYRQRMRLEGQAQVAVVVQRMVRAERAGVLFTRNPVTGAREFVIEAAQGLGEMLVGGRATPARYRLADDGALIEFQPGQQTQALVLGADGRVTPRPLDVPQLGADCLSQAALTALMELGRRCEEVYGAPQDLEWAIEDGALFLLQSRPITTLGDPVFEKLLRSRNVLNGDAGAGVLWSRVNVGEAIPGTVRALTAGFHRDSIELSPQRMFQRMGVFPAGPVRRPERAAENPSQFLCGKMTINVDYMRAIADRIPGTSGDALEEAALGRVRHGVKSRPERRRYPIIAAKLLWIIATLPRRLERLHEETHRWWHARTREVASADLTRAVAVFEESCERYARIIINQGLIATLSTGFWDPVARLVRRIGSEDDLLQLTAGYGNVLETRMLERLWDVSRGRGTLDSFLAEYGYLAASAGELAHPSWREDRRTLEQIVACYTGQPESGQPAIRQRATRAAHLQARARVLAAAPWHLRIALRMSLRLAGRMLPIREVGKACMVMGTDVGRAAARRAGALLAQRGDIAGADDVFHLTPSELRDSVCVVADRRKAVAQLKRLHDFYSSVELPDFFTSEQLSEILRKKIEIAENTEPVAALSDALQIRAIGVSRGRHSGIARVITDPNAVARFDPGDVLVCNITDPGWAALFSIAGAMVVDIGGMLSHSAIIARELGIPAVVNTRDGSRRIPDGARLSVDGATGIVTVLPDEILQETVA
ncbi:MAG: PEP/pyruvate-binding domain-containing protein [Nevskiales bacterium]